MRSNLDRNYQSLLREGIFAAQKGNKNLAWSLLTQATQMNPMDAVPWLWLTETTDSPEEKREYLESALAVDPQNHTARRGLARLNGENPKKVQPFSADALKQLAEQGEPVLAYARDTFLCPQCGGHVAFDVQANQLTCQYCGYSHEMPDHSGADQEQIMDGVLPTEKGHRWAASQHQLVCKQCGANSLWPPGQSAAGCPYCGSHQLIQSQETEGLVDPQAIAIMQIDEKEAAHRIVDWLGEGWTTPDDLKASARKSTLRPAYYPFWTFDGTVEIHWSCEVNDGGGDHSQWVAQSGVEFEMFDDVLVPGLKSLSFKDLDKLGYFNLKDVVEFEPDYLAGWPALTYNRSLARATLLAREQIIRKFRSQLHSRVLPGRQKRSLETGGLNWSDMTFKHVLLPVWIGLYRYKGHDYPVMVNGQLGHVTGEKPRDTFKFIGIIVSIIATLIVLGLILVIIAASMGWL